MAAVLQAIARLLMSIPGLIASGIGGWVAYRAESKSGALSGAVAGAGKAVEATGEAASKVAEGVSGGGIGFLALAAVAMAVLGGRR